MKVLMLEPDHRQEARGNAVTVARWCERLADVGVAATRRTVSADTATIAPGEYDIVHAHHGGHAGPTALALSRRLGAPLVVSLGGTDLNGPGGRVDPRAVEPLGEADAVIGPFERDGRRLEELLSRPVAFFVVRRGTVVPHDPTPPRAADGILRGVMVGAVRSVKGQIVAVDLVTRLLADGLPIALDIVGPSADDEYAKSLRAAIADSERVTWSGLVAREQIDAVYDAADFLLNTSENEGASNAILEAMARGRPVVARNVPGNREQLAHAPHIGACLFDLDERGYAEVAGFLKAMAEESRADRVERTRIVHAWVRARHDASAELRELMQVYRYVVDLKRRRPEER